MMVFGALRIASCLVMNTMPVRVVMSVLLPLPVWFLVGISLSVVVMFFVSLIGS